MKRILPFLFFISTYQISFSQVWNQKKNYAGTPRNRARAFSIPSLGKGFVIGGYDGIGGPYKQDTYEYDTLTNNWTQKKPFPGASTVPVAFSINGKGYAGTGVTYSTHDSTFWEYDALADKWTKKAHFPGVPRAYAVGFSIGGKGYMGGGCVFYNGFNDFYVYDPVTDKWDTIAPCPAKGVNCGAVGFSIGIKGYVGTGSYMNTIGNQFIPQQEFWEYDPGTNHWTRKADFPGGPRGEGTGFATCNKGYIGTGYFTPNNNFKNDFWEYDPVKDMWKQIASFPPGGQAYTTGFSIGKSGYIGLGRDSLNVVKNWYEYHAIATPAFTVTGSSSPNICAGQSISFADTSNYAPTNWQWSFQGGIPNTSIDQKPVIRYDAPGTYDVALIAFNDCDSGSIIFSKYVTVSTAPVINVTVNPPAICPGQSSKLTATGTGTYSWSPSAGLNATIGPVITASPTVTTTYSVTDLSSSCSGFGQAVVQIGGGGFSAGTISAARDTICEGTPGSLTVTGSTGPLQWQSATSGTFTDIINDTTVSIFDIPAQTTFYRVIAGTGSCADTSMSYKLVVAPSPVAKYNYTISGSSSLHASFNSDSSIGATIYDWDFGDGNKENGVQNPSHDYAKSDTFHVCLTVYNGSNCSFTICRDILVRNTTSVKDPALERTFNLFPNPVGDELFVVNYSQAGEIEIKDMLGRALLRQSVTANEIVVNVCRLPAGIYFTILRSNDGAEKVRKFVKK